MSRRSRRRRLRRGLRRSLDMYRRALLRIATGDVWGVGPEAIRLARAALESWEHTANTRPQTA